MRTSSVSPTVALVVIAALFLAIIGLISTPLFSRARIDLTDGDLYSLSEGTVEILSDLDMPINLKLYFSERAATGYPSLQAYAQRVEDLLYEYAARSGGRITVDVIEPEAFSEAEDEALAYDLPSAPTQDQSSIYFGLVGTNAIDTVETIGFFAAQREALLEYDITQLVARLSKEADADKPTLALISDLPLQYGLGGPMAMAQGQSAPFEIYNILSETFDVVALEGDFKTVPEGADLLMLAHATDLSADQLYAIDQFILAGGNAIILVDPHSEVASSMQPRGPMGMPQAPPLATSSNLARLFETWGVVYDPDLVVTDLELAQRVNMGSGPAGGIADYVAWLSVQGDSVSNADIVTTDLEQINLASSGSFTLTEASSLSLQPLLTSSELAAQTNVSEVRGQPDPSALIQRLLPTGERYTLAGRLSGPARSAFDQAPEGADGPMLTESEGSINVILIADSDLLADTFWVQVQTLLGQRISRPVADNGRFILNAADNMAGSDALISLRSRGTSSRPFTVIEDMRKRAERDFATQQQILENNLAATEAQLADLETQTPEGSALISDAQLAEIERFRADMVETRRQLRSVQRSLNVGIDRLRSRLTWLNILGIPVLILVVSGSLWWFRRARRSSGEA